jgi:RNA polymerase sigma factor (sigma-70 family)
MSETTGAATEDAVLYRRCRAGDQAAWEEVWSYVLGICRWGKWRLGDQAHDLASSAVTSLLDGGLKKVREPDRFRPFLKRVTVNRILDHLRRKRPDSASHDEWEQEPVEDPDLRPSLEVEVMNRASVETVMEAIEDLGKKCNELLQVYLSFKIGLVESYREMEGLLGKKANILAVEFRRCLERLRRDKRVMALA